MIPVLTKKRLYHIGIKQPVDTAKLRIRAQLLLSANPTLTPLIAVKLAFIELEREKYDIK